jgi:hypothetical protein
VSTRRLRDFFTEALGVVREAVDLDDIDGSEPVSPKELEGLSEDLTEKLPQALTEALALDMLLGEGEHIAAWRDPREQMRDAAERFFKGRRAAIAVVGPTGSGRLALLRQLERIAMKEAEGGELLVSRTALNAITVRKGDLSAHLAHALGLKGVETPEDLERNLLEGPRRVILIERAHNLYLRKIGGFDVLREALSLMTATQDKVLWVLESDSFAWRYLDHLFQVSGAFSAVLEVPALEAPDLREAFERRIKSVEEITFKFLPQPGLGEADRATWRDELFYERLFLASRGNPQAAGILFRQSIRWSEHLKTAFVLPARLHPFGKVLKTISRTGMLALALILEHESLSSEQLAELLLITSGEAQGILDTFDRYKIVLRQPPGTRFAVNPPWLSAIHEHLTERNAL